MVTLKTILNQFNCKHRFVENVENIELGNVSFDKIQYDQELIIFTNNNDPNLILRIDIDRRHIHLYQNLNEKELKVTRWLIRGDNTKKLTITKPKNM